MKIALLALMVLSLTGCGRNPQITRKTNNQQESLLPTLEPRNMEPQLILRDKELKQEGPYSFGDVKIGDKAVRFWEIVNIGLVNANSIVIPKVIGEFRVTNINCKDQLAVQESCDLKVEIESQKEKLEIEKLTISYADVDGKTFKLEPTLAANIKNSPVVVEPELVGRLILIPKNNPQGIILLKDVAIGEKSSIQLELKNVGEASVSKISLPELNAPYVLKSHNCPATLAVAASCDIFFDYSPQEAQIDHLNFSVKYNDDKNVEQVVLANAVRLVTAAKLELVDGIINQDIYDMLSIKPESLSPFQEIRGIDLGTLKVNREVTIPVILNNIGGANAIVTAVKDLQGGIISFNQGPFPGKNGTCSNYMGTGKCSLDIKVKPTDLKDIQDVFEISYQDGRGNLRRLTVVMFAKVKEGHPTLACKTITARSSSEQSEVIKRLNAQSLYKLPYKLKVGTAALDVLFNTDSNLNLRMTRNNETLVAPSVKNAMIQFGFDVDKNELLKYKSVKLELDILKVSTEGAKFDTTEVLCLNENRSCSGTFFIDSHFSTLNTKNYSMISNYFSAELLRSSPENLTTLKAQLAPRGLVAAREAAKSDNLFRLKKKLSLESLAGDLKNVGFPDGLNFVLADDSVLLSAPRLILETESEKCE